MSLPAEVGRGYPKQGPQSLGFPDAMDRLEVLVRGLVLAS
jgi:hypothetical protein